MTNSLSPMPTAMNTRLSATVLEDWELELLDESIAEGLLVYFIDFDNIGGLVMPLPLRINYDDGETQDMLIPAEIWRQSPQTGQPDDPQHDAHQLHRA